MYNSYFSLQALEVMHNLGYVHRDVSIGNILSYTKGKAKLADLEYAKEINSKSSGRELRTVNTVFLLLVLQLID